MDTPVVTVVHLTESLNDRLVAFCVQHELPVDAVLHVALTQFLDDLA